MSDSWQIVLSKPFTANDGDNRVLAMTEFHGGLYVGVGRTGASPNSANLYRLSHNGCKSWQQVTPPWSSKVGGYSMALLVYNNSLYVGTDAGDLYRSPDGEHWTALSSQLSGGITSLIEFDGCAYLSTGRTIWQSVGGDQWGSPIDLSTLNAAIYDVLTLAVFKNHLYAGAGLSKEVKVNGPFGETTLKLKGIQLWRTADGKNWSLFQDLPEPSDVPSASFYPEHVHAMAVYKGHLYVGEYHGKGLYRTDGSAASWDYIENAVSGSGSVFRLLPHNGKLYLGASHLALPDSGTLGASLLYASSDGAQWSAVPGCPAYDGTRSSVTSLMSYDGRLFVGTDNMSGSLEVWELGPEIAADPYEPNDAMASATPIDLGATMTQSSVELANLTLHGGDNDFFRIAFQEAGGHCSPGSPPKWEIGAGLFAQLVPSSLSIRVVEEYCRPLKLKVYGSTGVLVGEHLTAEALWFSCPSQLFKDGILYVAVSSPDAKPLRYSLTAASAAAHVELHGKFLYRFWEVLPPPYPSPPFVDFLNRIGDPYFDPAQFVVDAEMHLSQLVDHQCMIAKAEMQHGLGCVALQSNMVGEAERLLKTALAAYRALGIRVREASVLRTLGSLNSGRNMASEALGFFEAASQIHLEVGDGSGFAEDRMSLARHHLTHGDPARALAALKEAFDLQRGFGDVVGQVDNLICQSEAFFDLGLQEPAVAGLILAERLTGRISDQIVRQETNRRTALAAARLDAETYAKLTSLLHNRAEPVWREALRGNVAENS